MRIILPLMLILSSMSFSQIKYQVKASNGLIIRSQPTTKSEKVGKLNYKDTVIIKLNNIKNADTIPDNNYKIAGHWIKLDTGYVFDGFLKEINSGGDHKLKNKFYGDIKSVRNYNVRYHYKKSKDSLYKANTDYGRKSVFDKRGNCIEKYSSYNSKDTMTLNYQYKYDKNNNLILENNFIGDKIYSTETYTYNKKGQKTEKEKVVKGKPYYKWIYTYDKKGNQIEEEDYYYDRMRSRRWVSTYDDNNNKISTNYYNYHQEHDATYDYTYDNANKLLKATKKTISTNTVVPNEEFIFEKFSDYNKTTHNDYNKDGILKEQNIKTYNKNGILLTSEIVEKKHTKSELEAFLSGTVQNDNRSITTYNLNGDYIKNETFVFKDGKELLTNYNIYKPNYMERIYIDHNDNSIDKTTFFYDYKGNKIKEISYYSDGERIYSTTTYKYLFDGRNNWIEKREYDDNILKRVYVREITYWSKHH